MVVQDIVPEYFNGDERCVIKFKIILNSERNDENRETQ